MHAALQLPARPEYGCEICVPGAGLKVNKDRQTPSPLFPGGRTSPQTAQCQNRICQLLRLTGPLIASSSRRSAAAFSGYFLESSCTSEIS